MRCKGIAFEEAVVVADGLITLTDATFDEEWCGPCKMIAPVLSQIAAEHEGKLRIGKINIDENLGLAQRFDVMSIPTLILFKDGEPKVRLIGAKGKGQLLQELAEYL